MMKIFSWSYVFAFLNQIRKKYEKKIFIFLIYDHIIEHACTLSSKQASDTKKIDVVEKYRRSPTFLSRSGSVN